MTRQWRLVYSLCGLKGVLFLTTITKTGARSLFAAKFPTAKILSVTAEPEGRHYYEVLR